MLTEFDDRDLALWAVLWRHRGGATWYVFSQQPTRADAERTRDSWREALARRRKDRYDWAIVPPKVSTIGNK